MIVDQKTSPPGGTAERVGETIGYAEVIAERKWQLMKLNAAEKIAKSGSGLVSLLLVFGLGIVFMLTFNIGLGFGLSEWTGMSVGTSFLLLSAFYVLLIIIIYWQRDRLITNPILSLVVNKLF